MSRFLFPAVVLAWALGLAFVLIYVVVLTGPDTHLHLGRLAEHHHPDERAALIPVPTDSGKPGNQEGVGAEIVHRLSVPSGEAVEGGRFVFQAAGCARCHGLDARGGPVGPSLTNSTPKTVEHMAREGGPGGMPAYSETRLSDANLAAVATYLRSLEVARPDSAGIVALQRLTYDPSVPKSVLLKGKVSIRKSCGACHARPSKEDILRAFDSDAAAAALVAEMVAETNLNLEDGKAIARYMMAILHGDDPVKER